jgi:acyl-CoA dehydrogenase
MFYHQCLLRFAIHGFLQGGKTFQSVDGLCCGSCSPICPGQSVSCRWIREIELASGGKITVGKPEDKLGQRLSNTASVTFEDVLIEPGQIIGDRRLGFKYIIDVLDFARPMIAAIGVGVAKKAFDLTLSYTKERKHSVQRLCDIPVAREMLVQIVEKSELSELALLKSAIKIQENATDKGMYSSWLKMKPRKPLCLCKRGLHLTAATGSRMSMRFPSSFVMFI